MSAAEMVARTVAQRAQRQRGEKLTHCYHCGSAFSAANVFTEAGARETQISGMCESCFDGLFDDLDDEDE